jgi:hypothetical protein
MLFSADALCPLYYGFGAMVGMTQGFTSIFVRTLQTLVIVGQVSVVIMKGAHHAME